LRKKGGGGGGGRGDGEGGDGWSAKELLTVVQTVRLTDIEPGALKAALAQLPIIADSAECVKLIDAVIEYHASGTGKSAPAATKLVSQLSLHIRDSRRSDWVAIRVYGQSQVRCSSLSSSQHPLATKYEPLTMNSVAIPNPLLPSQH
jgi:hypothetical protein